MKSKSNQFEFLLASKSPRRHTLLKEMEIPFQVVEIDFEEISPKNLPSKMEAAYLASRKSDAYTEILKTNQILITADTTVLLENESLAKPTDSEDAFRMISSLSGKSHSVITAICLRNNLGRIVKSLDSIVFFKKIPEAEINRYINEMKPFDKAGSYGIQEWIGLKYVEKIHGSYHAIVGLPTALLWQMIEELPK